MKKDVVGVFGGTSLVGRILLKQLSKVNDRTIMLSRKSKGQLEDALIDQDFSSIDVFQLDARNDCGLKFDSLISVGPIWLLPQVFEMLKKAEIRRIVAMSSTSVISKIDSSDSKDELTVKLLIEGEKNLIEWAEEHDIEWIILRPTLIYGFGHDKNISEISRLIDRIGFFPLLGKAVGLRQPVHATDLATVCISALDSKGLANRTYNVSGGEILSYREMISRVFIAKGKRPVFLPVPIFLFRLVVACLRHVPRYRHWSTAMVERMNQDLVFDNVEASQELDFHPRDFSLTLEDVS